MHRIVYLSQLLFIIIQASAVHTAQWCIWRRYYRPSVLCKWLRTGCTLTVQTNSESASWLATDCGCLFACYVGRYVFGSQYCL